MLTALSVQARQANWLILALSLLFFGLPLCWAQDAPAAPGVHAPQAQPAPAPAAPPAPAPASPQALAIQALLKESAVPKLRWGQLADFRAPLEALYQPAGYAPLWTRNGKATPQAQQAVASLAKADEQGLNAADYEAEALGKWLADINAAPAAAPADLAAFDTALSLALARYVSHLSLGRINPKRVNFSLDIEPKKLDLPALLRKVAASDNADALLAAQAPKLRFYEHLKTALARYRQLAKDAPALQISLPPKFKPGDKHADVAKIRQRLSLLGDLAEGGGNDPSPVYDKPLAEAVKRFQARHGLTADGVLGKGTQAQLNVAPAERVKQILLGLERLRWLPDHIEGRYLMANIPSFQLFGFHNGSAAERPDLEMNVIVGEAIDGRNTPVFHSDMTYVNFRPYWNVPYAITLKEYVPLLSRNPGYLGGHDMEIVNSFAADAKVYAASRGNVQQLASGALKLRQRPGPKNALGLVKFTFPNTNNVYFHSTPAQGLFKRTRRDFSHGCVRVEYPVKLAEFVLKDQPEWTEEKIVAAMQADKPKIVTLKPSIPVYIFYSTVLADAGGQAMFYHDLYGHDAILGAELAKGFPYAP